MPTMSVDEFRAHVEELLSRSDWVAPAAFGVGVATVCGPAEEPTTLAVHYPSVNRGENLGFAALVADLLGVHAGASASTELSAEVLARATEMVSPVLAEGGEHPNAELLVQLSERPGPGAKWFGTRRVPVFTTISDLSTPPVSAADVYLRLHLLSTRTCRPHEQNLDGAFGLLENVVWTTLGPAAVDGFDARRAAIVAAGEMVGVLGQDKFPRMVDFVVPTGVRIADGNRVRLGAHLGTGTTVMHEGFVNFNAGTLGTAMVEGRISAGVVVGDHSDVGGGASIMGTLSGGGSEVISIGEHCLLGANSGLGVSLGDHCTVEAGLYLTAGTLVAMPDGSSMKARDLSGRSDMLFRRNSLSGAVEMIPQRVDWSGLNDDLHLHN